MSTDDRAGFQCEAVPPVFSAKQMDYAEWKEDAGIWAHVCKLPKDKIAGKMYLAQTHNNVKKVMKSITIDEMNSDNR